MSRNANSTEYSIGDYLFQRLELLGLGHIFGVPGDYIFELLHILDSSKIQYIGTCNELNAGYAADAYARLKGLGSVIVTYAVGGLSLVNAVAGAYSENVPLIVISGGPSSTLYKTQAKVHHTIGTYDIPLKIFENITIGAACIQDPESAPDTIDQLLRKCIQYSKPVYLEIPNDLVKYPCNRPQKFIYDLMPSGDEDDLKIGVSNTLDALAASKQPVILVGSEIQRRKLNDVLLELIEKMGVPFSTFITDKTTLPEYHDQNIGPCGPGIEMNGETKEYIENSDCVLCLGSQMAKDHLFSYFPNLNSLNVVFACGEYVYLKNDKYKINLMSFLNMLSADLNVQKLSFKRDVKKYQAMKASSFQKNFFVDNNNEKVTRSYLCWRLSTMLGENCILIADTGSTLISVREMFMPGDSIFLSQPYYASLGYSLPAVLGASFAKPRQRIFLVIGDGAFQFTCQELSTLIRCGLTPIIFVINNSGYSIERALYKDAEYNDIQPWEYHKVPSVFSGKSGREVLTVEDLESAIAWALANDHLSLIEVHLDLQDYCKNLGEVIEP